MYMNRSQNICIALITTLLWMRLTCPNLYHGVLDICNVQNHSSNNYNYIILQSNFLHNFNINGSYEQLLHDIFMYIMYCHHCYTLDTLCLSHKHSRITLYLSQEKLCSMKCIYNNLSSRNAKWKVSIVTCNIWMQLLKLNIQCVNLSKNIIKN